MSTSSPGEVSVSTQTLQKLSKSVLCNCCSYSRGSFVLKGLKDAVEIHTINHESLDDRRHFFDEYALEDLSAENCSADFNVLSNLASPQSPQSEFVTDL